MKYNKLVRDNIPEVIRIKGKVPVTHIADDREYGKKLEEKLQEEVDEFLFAKSEEEYADVLEVLEAIATFRKLDGKTIQEVKKSKAEKTGRFLKRIILDELK
jgi:predicted house-cleaning noncanonical NTP pyrophosphatase (MazG superfamily)